MPTSTVPFEVLFELTNDSPHDGISVQLIRGDQPAPGGATAYLSHKESLSLVLEAGETYKYVVRHGKRGRVISVRVWQDVKCGVSIVLAAPSSAQSYHLAQLGVTVQLDDR